MLTSENSNTGRGHHPALYLTHPEAHQNMALEGNEASVSGHGFWKKQKAREEPVMVSTCRPSAEEAEAEKRELRSILGHIARLCLKKDRLTLVSHPEVSRWSRLGRQGELTMSLVPKMW